MRRGSAAIAPSAPSRIRSVPKTISRKAKGDWSASPARDLKTPTKDKTMKSGNREQGTGNRKPRSVKDNRKRIELCNWQEEVPVAVQSKGDHFSAKAKARGIRTEVDIARKMGIDPASVEAFLDQVLKCVREGYDVQVCGAIHIYGCVKSLKTPFVAAKTMGAFRRGVADKAVRPTLAGKPVTAKEIAELNAKRKEECAHVSPDTIVECPNCGTTFRVGKVLK